MKCFSELGFCYRRPVTRSAPSVEAGDAFSPPLETRGGSGSRQRRRFKSGAASHWRPRLKAISEDVVAPADEKRTERLRKKSASKRGSSDQSYSYSFSHAEEYDQGPSPMSMVMPMFSPTPFMF